MLKDERRFNFTKLAIESLPTPAKREHFYDFGGRASVRGLMLRVEPTGSRTFYLYRKVKGVPRQIKLGVFPDLTVENARKAAEEKNVAIANHQDPTEPERQRRAEWTYAQLFDWYLEHHAKLRKKTWKNDAETHARHLAQLDKLKLSAITKAHIRQLHASIGARGKVYEANRTVALIRSVYNRAIKHDIYTGGNPAIGVELFRERSRERRLGPEEMPAFIDAVLTEPNADIRDYVMLSLYTGQRQANVLEMRWDQVDLHERTWRIPETKNGLPQTVPLHKYSLEILEARRGDGSPWVFPSRGVTGHMVEPKSGWRRILARANATRAKAGEPPIEDLRLHDLRRTLGSLMADTGASLPLIGKALGHKSQTATAIYARLHIDPVREAQARAIEAITASLNTADAT